MNLRNSTIGIWGFGRMGKAAARFFTRHAARVIVYDDNGALLTSIPYLTVPSVQALFNGADYVLPSPGIDTRAYRKRYANQWLTEVDIFHLFFTKPVIAITGSIGKTTTTHILTILLQQQGYKAVAAGNIGTPLFDIIDEQEALDFAVIELSSFQLEFAESFAPQLAIITNLYPNHLDRHSSMDEYLTAKLSIIKHQKAHQTFLVPRDLAQAAMTVHPKSRGAFFTKQCCNTANSHTLFCLDNDKQELHMHNSRKKRDLNDFPSITFAENWLTIWAALTLLDIPYEQSQTTAITTLAHRLEKVAEIKGITFYNDSKSTTLNATLAALEQFKTDRIILFLGGLSKGTDRTPLIQALQSYNVTVYCFGKEAVQLKNLCDHFAINAASFATLEDAFRAMTHTLQPQDCVLFSPAGSSYDLFTNYEERGNMFKKLVFEYKQHRS